VHNDIIIVGGGPAGISTALNLVRLAPELAARTLVIEKAHYPRPKLCAGGLVAAAEILLQKLDLDVTEIPHVDAVSAHLEFAGEGLTYHPSVGHALRIIRRDEFDAWLAAKARDRGIAISEGVTVKNIKPGSGDVLVSTDQGDYHAQVVVGADGSNSIVRRCVLPDAPMFAARTIELLALPKSDSRHAQEDVYFDFFPVPTGIAGYTWDFPTQVKSQPMRCWGIFDSNVLSDAQRPSLKETLSKEMARQGYYLDNYKLYSHPIRWFQPSITCSVPRVILAGDAAGTDFMFGEGISIALGYGRVAAQAIKDAFYQQDLSFKDYGRRVLFSPLGLTLTIRMIIARIVYKLRWAWFQKMVWRWIKPITMLVGGMFMLNWAKRLK
jgi:flavin-dependent dehydrogenase